MGILEGYIYHKKLISVFRGHNIYRVLDIKGIYRKTERRGFHNLNRFNGSILRAARVIAKIIPDIPIRIAKIVPKIVAVIIIVAAVILNCGFFCCSKRKGGFFIY